MKRPLKSKRPFGPIVEFSQSSQKDVEQSSFEPQEDSTEITDKNAILEQAETWYQEVSKEQNKRKMMRNYFKSMTDLSDSEVNELLTEAGL